MRLNVFMSVGFGLLYMGIASLYAGSIREDWNKPNGEGRIDAIRMAVMGLGVTVMLIGLFCI